MENSSGKEVHLYPAKMGYLPPAFVNKAERELNENPEVRFARLKELRKFMKSEQSLVEDWFTDEDLLMFLRPKKFDVGRALAALKKAVAIVRKYSDFFEPADSKMVDKFMRENIVRALPYRDRDGCLIVIVLMRSWNPNEISLQRVSVYINLILWNALSDPMTQVCGVKLIFDFNAPLLRYIRHVNPWNVQMLYKLSSDCVPMRKKAAHFLNPNFFSRAVLPFFLSFMPDRLRNRVFIHQNQREVSQHIDSRAVPEEYGGKLRLDNHDGNWISHMAWPDFVVNIVNENS